VYDALGIDTGQFYHHGMARPRVADGSDGLHIRRVAANILNEQSRRVDKGWSSILGVGRGANHTPEKNQLVMKCHTGPRNWPVLVNTVLNLEVPKRRGI
jgi:hypothetical protein